MADFLYISRSCWLVNDAKKSLNFYAIIRWFDAYVGVEQKRDRIPREFHVFGWLDQFRGYFCFLQNRPDSWNCGFPLVIEDGDVAFDEVLQGWIAFQNGLIGF